MNPVSEEAKCWADGKEEVKLHSADTHTHFITEVTAELNLLTEDHPKALKDSCY